MAFDSTITTGGTQVEGQKDWTQDYVAFQAPQIKFDNAAKEVVQATEAKDKAEEGKAKTGEKNSPLETAAKALESFLKEDKPQMTDAYRKTFTDAITDADKGVGSKAKELETKSEELSKKLELLLTKEKQEEIGTLRGNCDKAWNALNDDQKKAASAALDKRNEAETEDDRNKAEADLKKAAPALLTAIKALEDRIAPIAELQIQLRQVGGQLAAEKDSPAATRVMYGIALLKAGDKPEALKQFEGACDKRPLLFFSPQMQALLKESGGDLQKLKEKYMPKDK